MLIIGKAFSSDSVVASSSTKIIPKKLAICCASFYCATNQ